MSDVINHLWQSTLYATLVAVSAILLRNNQAKIRHWLWLTASVKFLIPFSLLLTLGTQVDLPPVAPQVSALTVEQVTASFSPIQPMRNSLPQESRWPQAAAAIWFSGLAFFLIRWLCQWLAIRRTVRRASPLRINAPIPVLSSASSIEPGVFGILRPVMLLPEGITNKLSAAELDAILAHELLHVRRRDNLTAALHTFVKALFWFHPLVWWIGSRMIEERERACDEEVLRMGKQPQVYATGILNVCKYYVESPVSCASGVSGGELRKRIEDIMTWRPAPYLTFARKLALLIAGIAAMAAPVVIGILRAQTLPPPPQFKFEVASIRPSNAVDRTNRLGPDQRGGLRAENVTASQLIGFAYGVRPFQIAGGPRWVDSDRFNITATPDQPEARPESARPVDGADSFSGRVRQRVQALLIERFGLVLRAETRKMPVYSLVVAKGRHKLAKAADEMRPNMSTGPTHVKGTAANMQMVAFALAGLLRRRVIDETGLTGLYDLSMEYTMEPELGDVAAPVEGGQSIFTAIQSQLGLKLESKQAPAPVFVIEKIEKPSEN